MTEITEDLQCELNLLHNQETIAVQQMLLLALRNGFIIDDLSRLAGHYHTSAAVVENHNGHYRVHSVTGAGYSTHRFHSDYQSAQDFADTFDTWWY
ncbi:hypothetical protein EL09_15425 [Salmonella enterica subsp. enterica]|nr:hypothetical protein [Salmonella enterica subsp. enterica]MIF51105.1 hypothetical protein [Salmonella enterica subsp. enterica]